MEDRELWVFVRCLYSGVVFGIMFDCFKIIRESFCEKARLTKWCDGLFWTFFTVFFVRWIFKINDGDIRWFVFAGSSLGAGIYFLMFSAVFVKVGMFASKLIRKTAILFVKIIAFPLRLFMKITGKAVIFAFAPVRKILKKMKAVKRMKENRMRVMKFCAKKI